jgi:hypothetical protein
MPTGRHTGHRGPNIHYKARSARANRIADQLAPVIAELQAARITSLNGIAAALNERRVARWGRSLACGASLTNLEAACRASPAGATRAQRPVMRPPIGIGHWPAP